MNRRDVLAGGLAALSAAMPASRSFAYPDRAVRLVVPFSPGGATDVVGRLWAEKMKPFLGTVVTENRGGGGGVTGATEVARAQPDGHTFLFGNTSTQVLIPAIMHNPPYDPLKDFVGIYILCNAPTSIVVHESVPARNLQELIAYARANPGKLSYGSAGAGTLTNLAGELFKQLIGAPDIVHIPYKGSAPGVADLASGHIPMMTPNVGGPLIDFHRAGKVHILAVNAATRIKAAPDIPTAIEAGLPGMIAGNLNGLFAPAGVAKPIVDRIAEATRKIMANADVQSILVASGFEPILDSGPDATGQFISEELCALDADHEGDRFQNGVKGNHGPRSPDPRARPSRVCGYDRKIPRRPARKADQHLSHAAQRAPARRELVQPLQYGAMEDDACRAAARDRDHPHGPSRQLAICIAPARAVAGARRRAFTRGVRCARGLARLQALQRERARRTCLCRCHDPRDCSGGCRLRRGQTSFQR
ncbi:MAG: tripartite tricarboxylate transporter substrate binding protein [Hyphomicrobiales bacterium]|nr:tripartite tricarboxylate transporter substrate binding protein [Hyphomicrobiales bacterium]